jgi:hypothetical protein
VPIGNVLCAAVIPHGLNFYPDAVVLLLLHSPGFAQSYHDAKVALAGVTHAARAAMATTARILLVIALSYLCSVHQFGPYVHSLISGDHGGSQTPDLRVRSAMLYSAELRGHILYKIGWRSRPDLNRCLKDLQSRALPFCYGSIVGDL